VLSKEAINRPIQADGFAVGSNAKASAWVVSKTKWRT
jgi:hypothetical protein